MTRFVWTERNEKQTRSNDNLLLNETVTLLDLIWTHVGQNGEWINELARTRSHTLKHNFQCVGREKQFTCFEMLFFRIKMQFAKTAVPCLS